MHENKFAYWYCLVWGKGGHSSVVCNQLTEQLRRYVCIDDSDPIVTENRWEEYASYSGFVAIGNNYIRKQKCIELESQGLPLTTVKSSFSYIAPDAKIGDGTFIAPGAIVQPEVVIGKGCIINTGATIDHGCVIGDYVHIAPGVHLCGNVTIDSLCMLGVGVSVIPGIYIADRVIVGAGSTVVNNLYLAEVTYVGTPAKVQT